MKKLMITIMMLLASTIIFAQRGHHDPNEMAQRQTDNLKNALALNDQQYAAVKSINDRYANQFMQMRRDSATVRSNKRTAIQNLMQEKQKEINAVLTPDQQTKYKDYQADVQAKRSINHSGISEKHRDDFKKTLLLTDDQQTKMDAASKSFFENLKKVKADSTLSKEGARTKINILRSEQDATVKNILSPEQYEKWQAYKAGMKTQHAHERGRGNRK
jgi:Spy/CpxP family protein refolding chaperone